MGIWEETSVNLSPREPGGGPEGAGTWESEEYGFEGWFYDIHCHLMQMYTSEPISSPKKIRITSLDVRFPGQCFLYGKVSSDGSASLQVCILNISSH